MITPGSYLEYIQDKKLLSAVCLRQDKPGKVFVRNARSREEKIADSKAMFTSEMTLLSGLIRFKLSPTKSTV